MKKKVLIIIGIVLLVFIGILVAIPVFFKDALLEKTKSTINRQLNAKVEFAGFRLSLLRDFPKASLQLRKVSVSGVGEFAGDTLLQLGSVKTSFGLFGLFDLDNLTLNEIILDDAQLNLKVNEANHANWDIVKESAPAETPEETPTGTFGIRLDKIRVNRANVFYTDHTLPMQIGFQGIDLALKGKMYGAGTDLDAEGSVQEFTLWYDSVTWISKSRLGLKSTLNINFDNFAFTFGESELLVNNLPLALRGSVTMPDDSMLFDLGFESKVSGLGEFLALVPPDYESYLKELKVTGNAAFNGSFKGIYFGENYPALQINLSITDGNARYASLPEEVKNITAQLVIDKPQGDLNLTSVQIPKAHAEIRNNPVDLTLKMDNLMEDPHFDGLLIGKINFDQLKEALPLDSVDIAGILDVNIAANGNYSAIETQRYENLKTEGVVYLDNFRYSGKQLTQPVLVSTGKLDFSPASVNLRQLDIKVGQSDFALTGAVSDYYPYLFTNGVLKGNLRLTSGFMNLNELMQLQAPVATTTPPAAKNQPTPTDSVSQKHAFKVPENIDVAFNTDVNRAVYDRLNISNIKGLVTVKNGSMNLDGLLMNMLNGQLNLTGFYRNTPENKPLVNLTFDLQNFDIPVAFQSFSLMSRYLPIASESQGKFNASFKLDGRLSDKMDLLIPSLNGNGLFMSKDVKLSNSATFNKLKGMLKEDLLKNISIEDFTANFTIENGNLILKPFKTKVSGQEATVFGRLNVDNLVDFRIDFNVQREALGKDVENVLGFLPGQKNIQVIPASVAIKGPVNNPDVNVDLTEAKQLVKKEVKEATKEELQKTINKVGEGLKKLLR